MKSSFMMKSVLPKECNMAKKLIFVLVLFSLLTGGVFAQKVDKHQAGAILIGMDLGAAVTPNVISTISSMFKGSDSFSEGNYAITATLGAHVDYYLFSWLSFNSGVIVKPGVYAFLRKNFEFSENTKITDIAKTPLNLTIPLMAHVNVPALQWLYAGAGLQFNFPMSSMIDSVIPPEYGQFDTKGGFFLGIPLDLGFDFIHAGQGGMRFFFRVTPEFHDGKTVVPIGFIWQVFNIKLH